MKRLYCVFAVTLFCGSAMFATKAAVSVDFFHNSLESYGDWQ